MARYACLIILMLFFYSQGNAQTFRITGGYNLSTMLAKNDRSKASSTYSLSSGFHLGMVANILTKNDMSIVPGIIITTKGFRSKSEALGLAAKSNLRLYYLDVPLTLRKYREVGERTKMFVEFGPYAGIGIIGRRRSKLNYLGMEEILKEKITWGKGSGNFRRLDLGIILGAGLVIDPFSLGINYKHGFYNISVIRDGGVVVKNRVFNFSVGYNISIRRK